MTVLLRVFVGLFSIAALIAIGGGFVFLVIMARGFGHHASDVVGAAGMLLAIGYFVAALVTCFPQFPAIALGRLGAVLHFVVMPLAVLLISIPLGSQGAVYLLPGVVFATVWFIMARTVSRSIP